MNMSTADPIPSTHSLEQLFSLRKKKVSAFEIFLLPRRWTLLSLLKQEFISLHLTYLVAHPV